MPILSFLLWCVQAYLTSRNKEVEIQTSKSKSEVSICFFEGITSCTLMMKTKGKNKQERKKNEKKENTQ